MDKTEIIGLVAGCCTASALLPQLITTIRKKKAADVSILMFLVMLAGNALWTWYGFAKSDLPVILTNLFSVALNIVMLILKIRYGGKKGRENGTFKPGAQ